MVNLTNRSSRDSRTESYSWSLCARRRKSPWIRSSAHSSTLNWETVLARNTVRYPTRACRLLHVPGCRRSWTSIRGFPGKATFDNAPLRAKTSRIWIVRFFPGFSAAGEEESLSRQCEALTRALQVARAVDIAHAGRRGV